MFPPEIKTIKEVTESRLKEKGSVFLASVFPVKNIEESETILAGIRKKYFDASHHCYAYRIYDNTSKFSDDGEPSGTAGLRILNAIDHFQVTNLVLIVTRYFGGTKLGVGPLGKAYYSAAEETLLKSQIITLKSYLRIDITVDFEYINHIHRILSESESKIMKTNYTENVEFECLITPDKINSIKEQITGVTRGNGKLNITNDYYLI